MQQLKVEEITKCYHFEDGVSLIGVGFKGEVPTNKSIVVDNECNIDIVVNKENYIAVKFKDDDRVIIIEDKCYIPGTPITYNPGNNNYTNWYVIKDNGETVTLMSNRSLYSSQVVSWIGNSDYIKAGVIPYNVSVGYNDLAFRNLKEDTST